MKCYVVTEENTALMRMRTEGVCIKTIITLQYEFQLWHQICFFICLFLQTTVS